MKPFIHLIGVAFLLFGLAACSQSQDHANQSEKKVSNNPPTSVTQNSNNAPSTPTPNESDNTSNTQNAPTTDPNQVPVTLVDTVDGDTIKVNYYGKVETVRYLLVDTPEEKKPGTCVQPFAVDAYNRNNQLVRSGTLTLEFEEKNKTDKYGRLLAYVFVSGTSVQETLLKEGFARVAYIYYPPYKYLSLYQTDEGIAKNQNLNIWSKPGYATAKGFMGCVDPSAGSSSTGTSPQPTSPAPSTSTGGSGSEIFANCTELRKKYPNGVPKGHPAYQDKMDRDKDGYACEQ